MNRFVLALALLAAGCGPSNGPKMALTGAESALDSIVYHGETSDFACYYPAGKYERQRLLNTAAILMANGSFPDEKYYFWSAVGAEAPVPDLDTYYDHIIDSMSRLEVLNFDGWTEFHRRIVDYNRRQFDRSLLENEGFHDPRAFYRYEGLEQDSRMREGVDLLVAGGDEFVGKVRDYMIRFYEQPRDDGTNSVQREKLLQYNIARLRAELAREDSVYRARTELFVVIANRMNHRIHEQNDILSKGNLGSYEQEYLKLFDSVREYNICEP